MQLFTEGQGAKIGGAPTRYFVVSKDANSGEVVVAPAADHPAMLSHGLEVWYILLRTGFQRLPSTLAVSFSFVQCVAKFLCY